MKTEPPLPPTANERNTACLLRSLVVAIIMLAIFMAVSGCVTTAPDGTRTEPDYHAWLEITRLILADETPPVAIPVSK